MMSNGSSGKKDLSFDVNVLPVIDVMSVCIVFLLLTTVWIHVGTMNVSQAIGDAANDNTKNPPTVTVTLEETGDLVMTLDHTEKTYPQFENIRISSQRGGVDRDSLAQYAAQLVAQVPEVATVNVLPRAKASYRDIIMVMDQFKKNNIRNVGISPL